MPILKVKKLRPKAFVPVQMTDGSAGYDLAVLSDLYLQPVAYGAEAYIAHTGIALEIPKGYYGEINIRSSIGKDTHIRLANQTGIIDSDYTGEIMLYLENLGTHIEKVSAGQRVAQIIIKKYETMKTEVVDVLSDSKRGTRGTGSTGK